MQLAVYLYSLHLNTILNLESSHIISMLTVRQSSVGWIECASCIIPSSIVDRSCELEAEKSLLFWFLQLEAMLDLEKGGNGIGDKTL